MGTPLEYVRGQASEVRGFEVNKIFASQTVFFDEERPYWTMFSFCCVFAIRVSGVSTLSERPSSLAGVGGVREACLLLLDT
jgi:hypothetical protein